MPKGNDAISELDRANALTRAGISDASDSSIASAVRASVQHLNAVISAAHVHGIKVTITADTVQRIGWHDLPHVRADVARPL